MQHRGGGGGAPPSHNQERQSGRHVSDKNVRNGLSSMPKLGVSWEAKCVVTDSRRNRSLIGGHARAGTIGDQIHIVSILIVCPWRGPNRTGATIMLIPSRRSSRQAPPTAWLCTATGKAHTLTCRAPS